METQLGALMGTGSWKSQLSAAGQVAEWRAGDPGFSGVQEGGQSLKLSL